MIGSFLNVVIHRIPLGQSLWFPSSHCPSCENPIYWYHNIPLWGYVIQKGRCVHCNKSISAVYPLVEIATALLLCLIYGEFGHTVLFYKVSFIALMMLTLACIDFQYHIIPDRIVMFSFPIAVLFVGIQGAEHVIDGAIGMAVGGLGMFIIAVIGRIAYKKDAMGGGDIKLAALLGIFLGWQALLFTLFVTFIFMTVVGWLSIAARVMKRGSEIPMAPFLTAAVLTHFFYGYELIHWYLDLMTGH